MGSKTVTYKYELTMPSQSHPVRFGHDATAGAGHSDRITVEEGKLVGAGVKRIP